MKPEITMVGEDAKWQAFAQADAAVAASGTVILELALAGIPAISTYKVDWIQSLSDGATDQDLDRGPPQSDRRIIRSCPNI